MTLTKLLNLLGLRRIPTSTVTIRLNRLSLSSNQRLTLQEV